MDAVLLAAKVHIPPPPRQRVDRPRLVDEIERGISGAKLVLVSAPAGYGKTTLLAEWARASRLNIAWLSLGAEDNDPTRFFRYLLAAWEEIQPGVKGTPAGLLLGAMMPDIDAVMAAFIGTAQEVSGQAVVVLDDVHVLTDPAIYRALAFLLDHLPTALHIVLASREEPPLPLPRYRARQELLEFHADALQFSLEEATALLTRQTGRDLSTDQVEPVHTQLEGWAAGLQLAALALDRHPEKLESFVVSGRQRFIADYLSDDVLAGLDDETRRFLLQTSILDRLGASVCEAVTGWSDGQQMLERLERANLFLVPLDDQRAWFRYHRIFGDFLRQELQRRHPDEIPDLHRRAAAWQLANDLPESAFRHAVEADSLDLMIAIFERYAFLLLHSGEFNVLREWLDALPAGWRAAYPLFDLPRAGLLAFTGSVEACLHLIDDVEQRLSSTVTRDGRWQLARVTAVRCFIACFQNDVDQAERFAYQALQDLRADDFSFRADIFQALGDTYRRQGRWQEAKDRYVRVLDCSRAPTFPQLSAHLFGALADLDLRQGRLRDAAASWGKARAAVENPENWGHLPLPLIGWIDLRFGELLYEWNELAQARDYLHRGLERAELGGDVRSLIAGYVLASRLTLTEGDSEAASTYLERARPLVEQASLPDWTSRYERCQVDLWLARDRLRFAVDWADALLYDGDLEARSESEPAQLALARVWIVKGDAQSRERAVPLLERLHAAASTEGRMGVQLEALALAALAGWARGDRPAAMIRLEHALRLAEPEGYVRLFADLGLPMARLLHEARSRRLMPDYIETLLAAVGADASSRAGGQALLESLSPREEEVLRLLAAGLTNRGIAATLHISPETVKKHTGGIYAKLGVGHRTEAVARARALDLLD